MTSTNASSCTGLFDCISEMTLSWKLQKAPEKLSFNRNKMSLPIFIIFLMQYSVVQIKQILNFNLHRWASHVPWMIHRDVIDLLWKFIFEEISFDTLYALHSSFWSSLKWIRFVVIIACKLRHLIHVPGPLSFFGLRYVTQLTISITSIEIKNDQISLIVDCSTVWWQLNCNFSNYRVKHLYSLN